VSVCLSVSLSARKHISKTNCPNFTKFSMPVGYGRSLVLFWRSCNMVCTSGFVNNVIGLCCDRPDNTVDCPSERLLRVMFGRDHRSVPNTHTERPRYSVHSNRLRVCYACMRCGLERPNPRRCHLEAQLCGPREPN